VGFRLAAVQVVVELAEAVEASRRLNSRQISKRWPMRSQSQALRER
jgi:hypothetical protein